MSAAPEAVAAPQSILVALDDSPQAQGALDQAIALAERSGAWITLLHVIEPPHPPLFLRPELAPFVLPDESELEQQSERLLAEAQARVPGHIHVHAVVRRGRVAEEIRRRVEAAGHDLVLIGTPGRRTLRAFLEGDGRVVLRGCVVPVVVVPAPGP